MRRTPKKKNNSRRTRKYDKAHSFRFRNFAFGVDVSQNTGYTVYGFDLLKT